MSQKRISAVFLSTLFIMSEVGLAAYDGSSLDASGIVRPGSITAPIPPAMNLDDGLNQIGTSQTGLQKDQWYSASRTVSMQILEAKGFRNVNVPRSLDRLTLVEGTQFQILKFTKDGQYAKVAIDEDGFSNENPGIREEEPVIAWVSTADVVQLNAQVIDIEALENLADLGIEMDLGPEYSNTEVAGRYGKSRRRGGQGRRGGGGKRRGGMTYCLADVRIWLTNNGRVHVNNIPYASIAYSKYKAAGGTPVSNWKTAPIGTACFYGGGRKCGKRAYCGHASVKIGPNTWKGAGTYAQPRLRDRTDNGRIPYSFQGCLAMPKRGGKKR